MVANPKGIVHEKKINWMTRQLVMKVRYLKGLTTAMYRSSTKLHKFNADAKPNRNRMTLVNLGPAAGESQPPVILQMKEEGTTLTPTKKSARASDTMKALVLVRSCLFLHTRKMMNPFPAWKRSRPMKCGLSEYFLLFYFSAYFLVRLFFTRW